MFRIVHFKTLDSTNTYTLQLAEKGAGEGFVVWTDFQTQGRGQFKRTWQSARNKGLLFSILLRPKWKVNEAPILTQTMAQVIQKVLKGKMGIQATLKRPNDILVNKKKICGILTESKTQGTNLHYVVVGVGLNVLGVPTSLKDEATSIWNETHKKYDREQVLEWILEVWKASYVPQKP